MREHPDRETLKKFISGQLASEDARLTDRHLEVCSECRDRADEISAKLSLQMLDSWLRPSYDEAFERAADRAAERLALVLEEARSTEDLLTDLLKFPIAERRRRIIDSTIFQTPSLGQLLRSRSREISSSDPTTAKHLADLSVEVALHLDAGRYGSSIVEDSRALAWCCLGNAYRITSDLWRAEQALRQAWLHHVQAGEDAFTETELLSIMTALRNSQGLYDEALMLSDRAIVLYRAGQDQHLEGSMLIQKSMSLIYQGRGREAIPVVQEGLNLIDPSQNERLLLAGRHNLVHAVQDAGETQRAYKMLRELKALYREARPMDIPRFKWLEGLILTDLNQFAMSERSLREVREFFQSCNLGLEVFHISVALAKTCALWGRRRQVKSILNEIIPLGKAFGLYKEVLEARLLYEQVSRV